jgi:fatty-acyl-CoA synthase
MSGNLVAAAPAVGGGAHWVGHVERHAHRIPDRVALKFEGRATTYAGLHRRIRALAAGLSERGVGQGDRVAVLMANRAEFVESLLAVNLLGAIAVPVNFRLSAGEVAHIVRDSGARLLFVDANLAAAAPADPSVRCVVVGEPWEGAEAYEDVFTDSAPPVVAIDERDIALIMYTSGTTGAPKGAMLSHLNLLMQSLTLIRGWRLFSEDEVNLCASPLFHIAAIGSVAPMLLIGATIVIMPSGQFRAGAVLDLVEGEQVTSMFLVPAQWQVLCADPGAPSRARSLRTIGWGAAPASVSLLEEMAVTLPDAANVAVFGQTEMSPVTCMLDSRDARTKIGSVGRPVPTVVARIVDDAMNDVEPGQVGEIVYRGPNTMTGYWNNPEATAEVFEGGWFHSGDLVRADEDGFIYVVDRKKDMIISGGENIYCAEVENVLAGHPAIGEVAVIGAKHARWGQTPVAIVIPADPASPPTLDDLAAWCRGRLASYKKPTVLVVVDSLPRNASGKVLKHQLRASYG